MIRAAIDLIAISLFLAMLFVWMALLSSAHAQQCTTTCNNNRILGSGIAGTSQCTTTCLPGPRPAPPVIVQVPPASQYYQQPQGYQVGPGIFGNPFGN